jgi:hypothetical protein
MTIYTVILFLHLLGALFLFMAFAVEWVIQGRVRSCATLDQAKPWLMAGRVVPLLGALGGIGVFIPGLYLAEHESLWADAWIQAAMTAAIVIAVLGMAFTGPRMRALGKLAMAGGQAAAEASKRLRDPLVFYSLRIRAALGLGVLFLMAAKPALMPTLVTMGVALALGIVAGVAGGSAH